MSDDSDDQLVPMTVRFPVEQVELMRRQAAALGMSVEEALAQAMRKVFDRPDEAVGALLDRWSAEQRGGRHLKSVPKD